MKPANKHKTPILCIVGSTNYIDKIAVLAWEREKAGSIVLGMHLLPFWYTPAPDHLAEVQNCVAAMDELMLRKIELADAVLVANFNGYIGESTNRAIEYATKLGKRIEYVEEVR